MTMSRLVTVNGNGKKIAALCLLLIVGGGWASLASRYGSQAEQVQLQTAPRDGSFLSDPNAARFAGPGLGNGELFLRMMLAVGIVVVLGVAALYLSKKVLPRVANTAGREIRIVETTGLGPRKALHLIEVGNRRLLIASTNDRVTMLTSLDETWLDTSKHADDTVEL